MAFDKKYIVNTDTDEKNILPLFGYSYEFDTRSSVEDIGSKITVTSQGNGKVEVSQSAPNLYFKTIGYRYTYSREKEPTGRKLELENRFQQLLEEKGKMVQYTKYVPIAAFMYQREHPLAPSEKGPKVWLLVLLAIFLLFAATAMLMVGTIVYEEQLLALIPEALQKMGVGATQLLQVPVTLIGGVSVFLVVLGIIKKTKWNNYVNKFKSRTFDELESYEKEAVKENHISYVKWFSDYEGEMLDIVLEMIQLNNQYFRC